ncbi:MAG: SpoIIE family protein phosphatase [Leptospiraceae bacterium]|nr:SpoIIE family protein phosphatase [Leptospiraceae bacterium]
MLVVSGLINACVDAGHLYHPDGAWQLRNGFERDWLLAGDSGWVQKDFPHNLTIEQDWADSYADYHGWITFRKRLPNDIIRQVRAGGSMAIMSGYVSDVAIFYINDRYIGQVGNVDPYVSGSYSILLTDIPLEALRSGPNYLTIAVFRQGDYEISIRDSAMLLGVARDVYTQFYRNEIFSVALLALYLAIGLYHMLLYIRRPVDRYNLLFGIWCVVLTAYWSFRLHIRDFIWADHVSVRITAEFLLLYFTGPLMLMFLHSFFFRKIGRVGWTYFVFSIVLGVLTIVFDYGWQRIFLRVWHVSALLGLIYIIFFTIRAIVKGNKDAWWLLGGIVLLLISAIHDILSTVGILDTPHVARFAFPAFIVGIAGILAARFMRVHNEVEDLNRSLEEKVRMRTRELQQTLNEVRALKIQQDGDYFLTSLLISPLGGNFAQSDCVDVDIFVRQKKRFHFKKWDAEIGGDLCTAHSVKLRGRTYTAVLNGDAMGKSIQGAGGALVLGVVFKSVITRTQLSAAAMDKHPEHWLKDCFLELQNIFVSFDGTMLISAVLGLVDDESGLFYYINAEHPWVVLYRKDTATFIEDDLILRKIGLEGLAGQLYVKTYQMQRGDVLMIGSDGRDDVILGVDEKGHRIINEDEYEFLRRVEEGRGDLEQIEKSILSVGEFSDDFTLVRVAWCEDAAPYVEPNLPSEMADLLAEAEDAYQRGSYAEVTARLEVLYDNDHRLPAVLRRMGQAYSRLKNFARAAECMLEYVEAVPADTERVYLVAYWSKLARDLSTATDQGERVRLRQPGHFNNLINLADCYRLLGNVERAHKLAVEARSISADNRALIKLEQLMSDTEIIPGRGAVELPPDSSGA